MEIKNKYGYVRAQESNSSIEFQKQQLIQNGIEEKNITFVALDLVISVDLASNKVMATT